MCSSDLFTRVHLARGWKRVLLLPLDILMGGFRSWFRGVGEILSPLPTSETTRDGLMDTDVRETMRSHDREDEIQGAKDKVNRLLFSSTIHMSVIADTQHTLDAEAKLQEIASSFKQFALPQSNHFIQSKNATPYLLSNEEVATIWHLPTILVKTPNIDWVTSKQLEPPNELPTEGDLTLLGESVFRGKRTKFGIKQDDRRRHLYEIGRAHV